MITFNKANMTSQHFPFQATTMNYIYKKAKLKLWLKFYYCCKLFYSKYRRDIIIGNFQIVPDDQNELFFPGSAFVWASNRKLKKFKNFWITESFISDVPFDVVSVPNFFKCTIKKLELLDYIQWKDFELLTKADTVKDLKIKGIFGRNDHHAPVEEIIAQVPNATSIEISVASTTPTTFLTLSSLKHKQKQKIEKFDVRNFEYATFKYHLFLNFLINNATPNCVVNVQFKFLQLNILNDFTNRLLESAGKSTSKTISHNLRLNDEYLKRKEEKITFQSVKEMLLIKCMLILTYLMFYIKSL